MFEVFTAVRIHAEVFRVVTLRHHGPPKRWCPITTLHGVTTQKNSNSEEVAEDLGVDGKITLEWILVK